MSITHRGEKFSGVNKPKRTPSHPKKSHAVLAKEGDKMRLIRFGQQGVLTQIQIPELETFHRKL